MSSLNFVTQIDGEFNVTESMSGVMLTAIGEVDAYLPEGGNFTFICANSTEENPVSINIHTAAGGVILGGDQTASGLVMNDYSVVALIGDNNRYRILSAYGAVTTL